MKTAIRLTVLFFFAFSVVASGQLAEKVLKEEFSADINTVLNIDSKFGHVEILNWDKPVVSVEVKLRAESDSKDLANETLLKLNAELSKSENEIFLKTIIEDRISSSSRRKVNFSVNYTIYAPDWINVKLLNKYGSVFIEKIEGIADINIQYGSLTIRELNRNNDKPLHQVSMAYSKGTIEKASWLKTDLSYSKLSMDDVRAIVSVSKYSSLAAENINSLVVDSKYDTYSVTKLRNFSGEMRYSNLKINELTDNLTISSSYTNVKVENVLKGFESIIIDNSRGGYRLGISNDAAFQLDGEAYRGDITAEGMSDLNRKVANADKTVWGSYGEKAVQGEIKVITRDGTVRFVVL